MILKLDALQPALLWLVFGVTLLLAGGVEVATRLFLYHPHIICILVGFASIAWYCWISLKERGLVRFLPYPIRKHVERVLHQPLFDFFYFNSRLTACLRQWVRVFLLQMDLTDSEIAEVTKGMSREFLHSVLEEKLIDVLPPRIQSFLVPPTYRQRNGSGAPKDNQDDGHELLLQDVPRMDTLLVNPEDAEANRLAIPDDEGGDGGAAHDWVIQLLCEKKIRKENMVQERSLRPVTQYIISSRLQLPLVNLQRSVVEVSAWWLRAGEWFCGFLSIAALYYPAASVLATRGNLRDVPWKSHKLHMW